MSCSECRKCIYGVEPRGDPCPVLEADGCPTQHKKKKFRKKKLIRVALVGNANVGKSVIFNQMTGMDQTIGNWAGKTVELAKEALEALKGKKLVVQEYLLNYLLTDENKHNELLDQLNTIKRGMYPYG